MRSVVVNDRSVHEARCRRVSVSRTKENSAYSAINCELDYALVSMGKRTGMDLGWKSEGSQTLGIPRPVKVSVELVASGPQATIDDI